MKAESELGGTHARYPEEGSYPERRTQRDPHEETRSWKRHHPVSVLCGI